MNLVTLLSVCVCYASILTRWKNSKNTCGILSPLSCHRCQDGIRRPPPPPRSSMEGEEMRARPLKVQCQSAVQV